MSEWKGEEKNPFLDAVLGILIRERTVAHLYMIVKHTFEIGVTLRDTWYREDLNSFGATVSRV